MVGRRPPVIALAAEQRWGERLSLSLVLLRPTAAACRSDIKHLFGQKRSLRCEA